MKANTKIVLTITLFLLLSGALLTVFLLCRKPSFAVDPDFKFDTEGSISLFRFVGQGFSASVTRDADSSKSINRITMFDSTGKAVRFLTPEMPNWQTDAYEFMPDGGIMITADTVKIKDKFRIKLGIGLAAFSHDGAEIFFRKPTGINRTEFMVTGKIPGAVDFIRSLGDGNYLLGGMFRTLGGDTVSACLMKTDSKFATTGDFNSGKSGFTGASKLKTVTILPDGRIFACGNIDKYNDEELSTRAVMLKSDGSIDKSFDYSGARFKGTISGAVFIGGRIILYGNFDCGKPIASKTNMIPLKLSGEIDETYFANYSSSQSGNQPVAQRESISLSPVARGGVLTAFAPAPKDTVKHVLIALTDSTGKTVDIINTADLKLKNRYSAYGIDDNSFLLVRADDKIAKYDADEPTVIKIVKGKVKVISNGLYAVVQIGLTVLFVLILAAVAGKSKRNRSENEPD